MSSTLKSIHEGREKFMLTTSGAIFTIVKLAVGLGVVVGICFGYNVFFTGKLKGEERGGYDD